MTHSLDRVGPERMSRRRVVLVFSAWILAVVGVLTVFVFGPTALHAHDRSHSRVRLRAFLGVLRVAPEVLSYEVVR
jgi:hypothetical protein